MPLRLTAPRFFNSLGALPDFSDSLIEYCYDRQTSCDTERQAYYFECLQVITEDRGTELLEMKVATLQSQDKVSRRDITAAYRYLNIPPGDAKNIADERLRELFQAQQSDLGLVAQEEARAHLYKLGVARRSSLLINASRQSVETYEDALAWFGNGVDKTTPDEGILAVVAIKVGRRFLGLHYNCLETCTKTSSRPLTTKQTRRSHKKQSRPSQKLVRATNSTIGSSLVALTVTP